MCGRYALWGIDDLGSRFLIIDPTLGFRSHFNIAPGTENPVIVAAPGGNQIQAMQWGLVPHWSKEPAPAHRLINARAETLLEKPMFRELLKHNRCIVPANGFYEWEKSNRGRVAHFVHLRNKALFGFAGLWDCRAGPDGMEAYTYAVITTESNEVLAPLHNRMPVILRKTDEQFWLSPSEKVSDVHAMLAPYASDEMTAYPVSPQVNAVTSDGGHLIRPVPVHKSWFE